MKTSREWLGTFFNDPLPESSVLADALTFHAFEIESVTSPPAGGDVLDIKVTPNRGHDCLSHRGIAKELSAILRLPMKSDALRQPLSLEPKCVDISIQISEPTLCSRYIAGYIRGVKVGPTPDELRRRLEAIGQRSINNVVDATNYVMFELGQPLHAFDAGRLSTRNGSLYEIGVRKARANERMIALDGKEYALSETMLIITDRVNDAPIGIAGVKGGAPAAIEEATKDIIIESANFDGVSVRHTAAALKLRTDASSRFEQNISPELAGYGMKAAVDLIVRLAGGELAGFSEQYPAHPEERNVSVTSAKVNAVLGTTLNGADVSDVFARLDLTHTQTDSTFEVDVPFERLDITIPEDLVEEVGRIVGYDTVPTTELSAAPVCPSVNTRFYAEEKIRQFLLGAGFSEVFTSVFSEDGERMVLNKVDSVRPYLRRDLLVGLRDALDKNIRNKDLLGLRQVKLFETGVIWRRGEEVLMLGLAVEKVKKEKTASDHLSALAGSLGGRTAAVTEEVIEVPLLDLSGGIKTPPSYDDAPLTATERYEPFSKYPFIVRDIAMWVPAGTVENDITDIIRTHAGELLIRADLFDRFEKDGRVSYAFRLVFQSPDRTLFDGDANERMESISAALKKSGFEIR